MKLGNSASSAREGDDEHERTYKERTYKDTRSSAFGTPLGGLQPRGIHIHYHATV